MGSCLCTKLRSTSFLVVHANVKIKFKVNNVLNVLILPRGIESMFRIAEVVNAGLPSVANANGRKESHTFVMPGC